VVAEVVQKRAVCFTCSQQCGHIAHIRDGQVLRLVGDREHPRTAGFICPKGAQAPQLHYSPDRLHRPLKRRGARGAGQWETISWEQAIEEIAAKILQLAGAYGPETVAHSFGTTRGSDCSIGKRFMNLLGSPNSVGQDKICVGPMALGEYLTYGFGPTYGAAPVPGLTQCLVLWGRRPMQSARPAWRVMDKALGMGTKLLVIDPARTEEAARADLWLQLRPGTDAALGLGLLNEIIANGRYDAEFVARETVGFEELKARAAQYPLEQVAAITGVPADRIRAAAHMMSEAGPTIFGGGNGLCQTGVTAVQQGRILACLIALTGNLNRSGGHVLKGPPRDVLANGDWMANDALPREQRAKALGSAQLASIRGYDRLDEAVSLAWYGKRGIPDWLSSAHEPTLWDAILTGHPYRVRALIIQAHNPIGGAANTGQARAALLSEHLELLVAHDLFLNATTCLADYVLPAAHWMEKPYFSVGGAYMGWAGDYVETNTAILAPEHEHRSDYDFFMALGRRCGQGRHWPETVEDFYQRMLAPAGLSFETVAAHLGPLTGAAARHADHHGDPLPPARAYGTLSGKVELYSSLLEEWGQDPLPHFRWSGIFDDAANFPLMLVTGGRQIEGFHQNAQQTAAFRNKNPHPFVTLHPDLARSLGIEAGQWVEIESPIGRVRQMARIDDRYAPDVVHADRWWYPERAPAQEDPFGVVETSINMCTSNSARDNDPIMGSWLMRGLPCRIVIQKGEIEA
jgi:thiosulfate reductase/polysulfide reductase chain A